MLSVYPKRGLSPMLVICQLCVTVLIFFAPIVVVEVEKLLFIKTRSLTLKKYVFNQRRVRLNIYF